MTGIKLCGIKRLEDINTINDIKPEYVGFVFAKTSKRFLEKDEAIRLKKVIDPCIKTVGVFVDEDMESILRLSDAGILDMVQLHGCEDEKYILNIKREINKPVIKAFQVKGREDVVEASECMADHILLDAGTGDGRVFDWDLLGGIKRPYFLAGGLNCNNVVDAVKRLNPYAVDVSSGIETNGIKDAVKMVEFVKKVRSIGHKL
ncbi:MAG: phosphoribosylanthranilate isomerase [Lachnospiraceae bacterium]|nr:phosphoribosylanthranilate isomerase [Lachnospiraceae bacterium]